MKMIESNEIYLHYTQKLTDNRPLLICRSSSHRLLVLIFEIHRVNRIAPQTQIHTRVCVCEWARWRTHSVNEERNGATEWSRKLSKIHKCETKIVSINKIRSKQALCTNRNGSSTTVYSVMLSHIYVCVACVRAIGMWICQCESQRWTHSIICSMHIALYVIKGYW